MSKVFKPWEETFNPFKIFGNLYFVGNSDISIHVLDTGNGLIVFDTGYQHSLYITIDNMYRLGLNPHDIKYICLTHGHIDHIGAAKALKELSGAKIALGKEDRLYVNGGLDLSFAKELDMEFNEIFEPDILLSDGDIIKLGNTVVKAVATPGHTEGAISYFFNVTDGEEIFRAGLHGGMGINTLSREFLKKYNLPLDLREAFRESMLRLNREKVDIFLGNHAGHNHTVEKSRLVAKGNKYAFIKPDEWAEYNLWCIRNLDSMIEKEEK